MSDIDAGYPVLPSKYYPVIYNAAKQMVLQIICFRGMYGICVGR